MHNRGFIHLDYSGNSDKDKHMRSSSNRPKHDFSMHLSNFMMKLFNNNPYNISMREFRLKLTNSLKTANSCWPFSDIGNSPKVTYTNL